MTRTSTGLCLAAAFGLAVSLGAQTTSSSQTRSSMDQDRDSIAVTGCLQRDPNGGYILSNAHIDTTATSRSGSTTTGTTGTTTTGTTGTTAGAEANAMAAAGSTWKLEGSTSDLDKHVGHKVTVTGRDAPASSSSTGTTATTGTTGEEQKHSSSEPEHRLDVRSVKMVSSSCP
jgi:hypothetical protein